MRTFSRGSWLAAAGWALIALAGCDLNDFDPHEGEAVELPGVGVVDPAEPRSLDAEASYRRLAPSVTTGRDNPYSTSSDYPTGLRADPG